MEYRFLGNTGLSVSELCLGTITFGRWSDASQSTQVLDAFADAGGTFIDTANGYSDGISEEILGSWLRGQNRDDFVIATKVFWDVGVEGPNQLGLSRKHIISAVDASLRRLGVDYIDLYQVHFWDSKTPLEETLSTLDGLVKAGKVRYLGASNFTGWQLQKAVSLARHRNWEPFSSFQPQYNLIDRATEWEMLAVCAEEGLGVIPWAVLREGWLTGKYSREMTAAPANTRLADHGSLEKDGTEQVWRVIDTLVDIGQEIDRTPAQIAINWVLDRPAITAPIIGARTPEQLKDNLGAIGWRLSAEHRARLDEVSAVPVPNPYSFVLTMGAEMGR